MQLSTHTYMILWMWDDISSWEGFTTRGLRSSAETTSWAFDMAAPASSQKEPIVALSFPQALEPPSEGEINSKEDVGDVRCWGIEKTMGEMTMGSSFIGPLSLCHFLDRRPSFNPILAFFSWTSANFPLLNLVAIPKGYTKKRKGFKTNYRKEYGHKKKYLLFLTILTFWTWLGGFGPRKWRKRDWGEMSSSNSLTFSSYSLTLSKRLWYYFFKWRQIETAEKKNKKKDQSLSIISTWKIIRMQGKWIEGCTRHRSTPTTKQFGSVI